MRRTIVALAMAASLAGCGAARGLKPAAGETLPPAPYGATAVPQPGALLTPTPQQRPQAVDELLTRSRERTADPFDLPPPDAPQL